MRSACRELSPGCVFASAIRSSPETGASGAISIVSDFGSWRKPPTRGGDLVLEGRVVERDQAGRAGRRKSAWRSRRATDPAAWRGNRGRGRRAIDRRSGSSGSCTCVLVTFAAAAGSFSVCGSGSSPMTPSIERSPPSWMLSVKSRMVSGLRRHVARAVPGHVEHELVVAERVGLEGGIGGRHRTGSVMPSTEPLLSCGTLSTTLPDST